MVHTSNGENAAKHLAEKLTDAAARMARAGEEATREGGAKNIRVEGGANIEVARNIGGSGNETHASAVQHKEIKQ